jgi:TrmH family RNA methyltransferase
MPSLSAQKLIRKLRQRKFRWQEQQFVAEGPKIVQDLIQSGLQPDHLWSTAPFFEAEIISEAELKALSHLSTPNQVLAIFPFPKSKPKTTQRVLILDGINDPGNLGTLLRTADWFGFTKVYCTTGTADVFNAKTVQSTMGSLARLEVRYADIENIQKDLEGFQVYIAEMRGQSINSLSADGASGIALVMGSESHGPNAKWRDFGLEITIARASDSDIDSLNVGVAGGILMQHFAS